jgi:Zn-dependent peptidase ImmA (M78 family)/transcriptional regulator with XRE-family HTH domain
MVVYETMATDLTHVGKNIRFFRRSRNWTLAELAAKIKIQEGPLGRIERGMNLPSACVLLNLSSTLNVSMDALFAPDPCLAPVKIKGTSKISDACFVSITKDKELATPPKHLLKACHNIMAAFHALEDICKVQKHAFLPLSIPFTPTYKGMENLAARVRKYLGTNDAVVFDYFELFENFGLRIILFPFTRNASKIESLSFYEPAFHNAFFFLNSKSNNEKKLFSLAKELGKILISNQTKLEPKSLFTENKTNRPITPDRAARRFASTLLMPETAVRTTVSQLGIKQTSWSWELLLRIKHRFGVSTEAFLYRLDELNLIAPTSKDELAKKIKEFYDSTNFKEPDSTRRCLTSNGRFFDLLLTAQNINPKSREITDIKKLTKTLALEIK